MGRHVVLACAGVAALVAVLSGCGAPRPDSAGAGEGNAAASGIPSDWTLSDEDLNEAHEDVLEGLTEKYPLDGPITVDLVRFVSADEWAEVQTDCITARGFDAVVNDQGGVTFGDTPPEQAAALTRAAAECEAMYPIDPRYQMVLPRKRAEAQYDFLVETQKACVEALGYVVSDPPSRETWLEQYYATGQAWDPFSEAAEQVPPGSEGLDELYRSCPVYSEDVYPPLGGA